MHILSTCFQWTKTHELLNDYHNVFHHHHHQQHRDYNKWKLGMFEKGTFPVPFIILALEATLFPASQRMRLWNKTFQRRKTWEIRLRWKEVRKQKKKKISTQCDEKHRNQICIELFFLPLFAPTLVFPF